MHDGLSSSILIVKVPRVLLLTDEPLLSRAFLTLAAQQTDIEAASICGDPAESLDAVAGHDLEVLLLDFVPEEHFPALLLMRKRAPRVRVVLWVQRISLEAAYQAMRAGARGILRKTLPAELMLKCIRKVAAGVLTGARSPARAGPGTRDIPSMLLIRSA